MESSKKHQIVPVPITQQSKDYKKEKVLHKTNRKQIDKKLDQIEKLKNGILNLKKQIDKAKQIHLIYVRNTEIRCFKTVETLIVGLYKRYMQPDFIDWQKELLLEKINAEIEFLYSNRYESEIITRIEDKITEQSSEVLSDKDRKKVNKEMKDYIENSTGVELDDDFDYNKIKNKGNRFSEILNSKIFEKQKQVSLKKQKYKVENTDKDFQKLYKKLVRKSHPDLAKDPKIKKRREDFMKRLSSTWEKRDYYRLLLLDREADNENGVDDKDPDKVEVSSKHVKSISNQLNEEIQDLQEEEWRIKEQDPETSFLLKNISSRSEEGMLKKADLLKKELEGIIDLTIDEINSIKTFDSTKDFLARIRIQYQELEGEGPGLVH